MTEFMTFVIIGLTSGAVYGLAGLGLVLTYKTSGVFNFAHGALATVSAYAFYSLHIAALWHWVPAAAVCVLVIGPVMGLILELIARRVSRATLTGQVAATVGLMLAIQATIQLAYGNTESRLVPVFLSRSAFEVLGVFVPWSTAVTLLFSIAVTVVLSIFLRRARIGIAMRAVVDSPDLLDLSGTDPTTVRRAAWVVGSCFAAASGVLFAPLLALDPVQLTLLVVAAFGAGAIGRFTSLPATFTGGLLIGVLASLATRYVTSPTFIGLPQALPFLVLFVVLILTPRRSLWSARAEWVRLDTWHAPTALQAGGAIATVTFFGLVPLFAGVHLISWTVGVAMIIVFLSLSLLVQSSGQVSLCHVSFTAIGAAAMSHLAVSQGLPWLVALMLAALTAVPIGALLAIPAIRQSGLYLALATLGFGLLLQYMFYSKDYFFTTNGKPLAVPSIGMPVLDGDPEREFYYVVLAVAVLTSVMVVALTRSRLGRLLATLADSPTALASNGATAGVTRTLVFSISAALAALGGALAAAALGTASGQTYSPILSLTYFVVIVITPGRAPFNAVGAALAFVVLPAYVYGENLTVVLQLVAGLAAILLTMFPISSTRGHVRIQAMLDRRFRRGRRRGASVAEVVRSPVQPMSLEGRDITVTFGGLTALSGVTALAETGRITGLIGPNGAGKTTLFNVLTGFVDPRHGQVLVDGHSVTRRGTAARARRGIGRTFQRMELCESLSAFENVLVGAECARAGANPLWHVFARMGELSNARGQTEHAMRLCGIDDLAGIKANDLSTGQRRLVELARCLAGDFQIVLLDEPSSGLDDVETAKFAAILRSIVAERNIGILLVEHDMSLVMDVCDSIHVLDFGHMVFSGAPDETANSPIVQAAYLGDAAIESETRVSKV